MAELAQIHFEFKDYKEAFKCYRENVLLYSKDKVRIVISVHEYTSGYWIEGIEWETGLNDHVYIGDKAEDLINRVETEIATAEKENRVTRFII